jgi:hypothetical protein
LELVEQEHKVLHHHLDLHILQLVVDMVVDRKETQVDLVVLVEVVVVILEDRDQQHQDKEI